MPEITEETYLILATRSNPKISEILLRKICIPGKSEYFEAMNPVVGTKPVDIT
jgi:hypothetical protein